MYFFGRTFTMKCDPFIRSWERGWLKWCLCPYVFTLNSHQLASTETLNCIVVPLHHAAELNFSYAQTLANRIMFTWKQGRRQLVKQVCVHLVVGCISWVLLLHCINSLHDTCPEAPKPFMLYPLWSSHRHQASDTLTVKRIQPYRIENKWNENKSNKFSKAETFVKYGTLLPECLHWGDSGWIHNWM